MDDLISRKAALQILYDIKDDDNTPKNYGTLLDIIRKIRELPTAFGKEKVIDIIAHANSAITIGDKDKALYWTKKLEEIVEKGGIE